MAIVIDAPMPKGKCWWEENGVEHECHLFPCWGNADNCPIIGEIPDSHGRLIDADALLPKSGYDPMMFKHKYDGDHRTQYDTLMGYEILGIVEDAPTIVEATE